MLPSVTWRPFLSERSGCCTRTLIFREKETRDILLVPAFCHRWDCPLCCKTKARLWIKAILQARPTHAWEFTMKQDGSIGEYAQCVKYRQAVPAVLRKVRREIGNLQYLYTYELHKKKGCHIHGLHRGPSIPHRRLQQLVMEQGLGHRVSIRGIEGSLRDICHQVKYLFKADRDHRAGLLPRNIVNKSRNFLIEPLSQTARSQNGSYELFAFHKEPLHELLHRNWRYPGRTAAVLPNQHDSKVWLDKVLIQDRGYTTFQSAPWLDDDCVFHTFPKEVRAIAEPEDSDRGLDAFKRSNDPLALDPMTRAGISPIPIGNSQALRAAAALTALRSCGITPSARREGDVR